MDKYVMDTQEDEYFTRNPIVTEQAMGETVFLVDPGIGTLFRLDKISTAVWRLLKEPMSIGQIVEILHEAFPDTPAEEIEDGVTAFIEEMVDEELVFCDNA